MLDSRTISRRKLIKPTRCRLSAKAKFFKVSLEIGHTHLYSVKGRQPNQVRGFTPVVLAFGWGPKQDDRKLKACLGSQ